VACSIGAAAAGSIAAAAAYIAAAAACFIAAAATCSIRAAEAAATCFICVVDSISPSSENVAVVPHLNYVGFVATRPAAVAAACKINTAADTARLIGSTVVDTANIGRTPTVAAASPIGETTTLTA
jgi:hypothetical protein